MFILADTEKNSSKSFSSLNDLKKWVDAETGHVGLEATVNQIIKNTIAQLNNLIGDPQEEKKQDPNISTPPKNIVERHYKEPETYTMEYFDAVKKRDALEIAESATGESDILTPGVSIVCTTCGKNLPTAADYFRHVEGCPKKDATSDSTTQKSTKALNNIEPVEKVKNYLKDSVKQSKFLQSSRWISPEAAGYESKLGEGIDTLFKSTVLIDDSKLSEMNEEHDENTEEIIERWTDIIRKKNTIITPRVKEMENILAKWVYENCIDRGDIQAIPLYGGAPTKYSRIELNVFWNILIRSKGDKEILGDVDIPEEILSILQNPELEGYASTYRNVEQTSFLSQLTYKTPKDPYIATFKNILNYFEKKAIKFQNVRPMDVVYKAYIGMYTNGIRIQTLEDWILAFVAMRLKKENKEDSVKSSVLYTTFMDWLDEVWLDYRAEPTFLIRERICTALKTVCSQKSFSSILKSVANLTSVRKADGVYWVGVALTDTGSTFAPFESGQTLGGLESESYAPVSVYKESEVVKSESEQLKKVLNDPAAMKERGFFPSELSFGLETKVPGKS
jgi:hypothetical protein